MNPIGMNPHSIRKRERYARYARRVRAYVRRRKMMSKWTVWVGGSEMSSNLLSHSQALKIVKVWKELGYDDVIVEEVA
jgi:hypothetical protein